MSGVAAWFRALVRTTPAPIQWDRVILTAVGIATPIALGLALAPAHPSALAAGALASMGAMGASTRDAGAVGIERVHRMAWVALFATLGFALGTLVYGHPVETFIAVVAATLVSGLSGTVSATASRSGLFFLVYTVTAANADFGLSPAWLAPLVFGAGAVWRLALTAVVAAVAGPTLSPERRAVAGVYGAIADQLAAIGPDATRAAAARLTSALDDAYDVMVAARTWAALRDPRWHALVAMLNASAPVVDAAIAVSAEDESAPREVVAYLRALSTWIEHPAGAAAPTFVRTASTTASAAAAAPEVQALVHAVGALAQLATGWRVLRAASVARGREPELPAKPTLPERLRTAGRSLMAGDELWFSVLRLVLCMAVAQGLSLLLQLERPYLVMITVAQVMKPDFGSVFARAVQRGVGTVIGVGIGTLAVALVPRDGWQLLVIAVLAGCIPIAMSRSFALYSAVSTPLAVLLVELHVGPHPQFVEARMLDTVLGCAIVLLLGYLPWPSTWRSPRDLAEGMADLVRALVRYLDVAIPVAPAAVASAPPVAAPSTREPGEPAPRPDPRPSPQERVGARREAYRRVADLRTRIAKSQAEPPAISAAAASWLAEVDALERVTDAITAVATTSAATGIPLDARDLERARRVLDDLAGAIAEGRAPRAGAPLPVSAPLAALADQLRAARAVLPALTRSRRP